MNCVVWLLVMSGISLMMFIRLFMVVIVRLIRRCGGGGYLRDPLRLPNRLSSMLHLLCQESMMAMDARQKWNDDNHYIFRASELVAMAIHYYQSIDEL